MGRHLTSRPEPSGTPPAALADLGARDCAQLVIAANSARLVGDSRDT
jgi:hypothetical protein